MRRKGFTLIELMIVIAIIAIIAAIAIPGLLSSQRAANERNASASLKTLATSQIDFRSNDRDGNRVNDFWTANVAGLYAIQTSSDGQTWSSTIKLCDPSIAAADCASNDDLTITAQQAGQNAQWYYKIDPTTIPTRGPKAGYWYYVLLTDMSEGGQNGDPYQAATDGTQNNHHHASKFAIGTFPDTYGVGRSVFIINESATIIRYPLPSTYSRPKAGSYPPGALADGDFTVDNLKLTEYPSDTNLSKFSRMD